MNLAGFRNCLAVLRSESPSGMCAKLSTVAASNNRDHSPQSLFCFLFAPHICGVVLRAHPVRGESHIQRNASGVVAATSLLLTTNPPIARSFCEGFTRHDLLILVAAPFCCDWEGRAACAQSFALWQQATIEITRHNHSIIACSRHIQNTPCTVCHPAMECIPHWCCWRVLPHGVTQQNFSQKWRHFTCLCAWASEGIFPGMPLVDFSKRFSTGGQKWWNLLFTTRN